MSTVAVLMSTYNGEKYIREQLDSIFAQKNIKVKLFVRDDGSTDNTINILEEYARAYSVEIVLDGENVGPGESFMRLVYKYANEPDIEYYAFADQDDIWLNDKLSIAVQNIMKSEGGRPTLDSFNQFLYIDGENKGIRHKEPQRTDLISHITKNTIAGCTFVFNKSLALLVANADKPKQSIIKYRLHDSWIMLVAIACGRVIYDEAPHMLYRIHNDNVVGVRSITPREKVKRLFDLLTHKGKANIRMNTASELLRLFPEINSEDKEILKLFASYKDSIIQRIKLLSKKEIVEGSLEVPIVFVLKVLLGSI